MFGLEIRKLVYNEWWILKGGMGNGEWGILRFCVTSGGHSKSQNSPFPIPHSPAKFQNSPANSPSVKMSSTNENVRGMGNGKRDLTHS